MNLYSWYIHTYKMKFNIIINKQFNKTAARGHGLCKLQHKYRQLQQPVREFGLVGAGYENNFTKLGFFDFWSDLNDKLKRFFKRKNLK